MVIKRSYVEVEVDLRDFDDDTLLDECRSRGLLDERDNSLSKQRIEFLSACVDGLAAKGVISDDLGTRYSVLAFLKDADNAVRDHHDRETVLQYVSAGENPNYPYIRRLAS